MDLVGQEHVKITLTNALKTGKFSHAYLFAGPKGSGKTTTARLLAKALNCTGRNLSDQEIEPCEKCLSCREITAGQSMDMIEIDAASNRGIDEIRELRDKIRFAPTAGKFKIYVVDECHKLTKEAFNALLKTLEEPPKHAIFILATTELHKVPATILSRVQVFDFKAKIEDISLKLKKIVKAEKIQIEEEALGLISRLAYGAFRDAETMLDQVANLGAGQTITLSQVQIILGETTEQSAWDLAEYIANRDRAKALGIISDIYFEGKNLESFVLQLVEIFRKALLAQNNIATFAELTKDEAERIERLGQQFTSDGLVGLIEKLTGILPKVKTSILGQLPLEMVVFELTKTQNDKLKIKNYEEENKEEIKIEEPIETTIPKSKPIIRKPEVRSLKSDSDLSAIWPELVKFTKNHNNGLAAMLKDATIHSIKGGKIVLGVKFKFHAEQICNQKNRRMLEEELLKRTNQPYQIDCIVDPELKIKKPVDADEELLSSAKEVFAE